MVIAVRAAMSHYAPHLLFIKPVFFHLSLSTPSVLSCARHLLWRVSLFLRSLARHDAGLSYVHSSALYAARKAVSFPHRFSPFISAGFYPALLAHLLSRDTIYLLPTFSARSADLWLFEPMLKRG